MTVGSIPFENSSEFEMLQLPLKAFERVMIFSSTKDAFKIKRVCREIRDKCAERSLWKAIFEAQYPALLLSEEANFEKILRSFAGGDSPPPTGTLEFILVFSNGGVRLGTFRFEYNGIGRYMNESVPETLASILRPMFDESTEPYLEMTVFIVHEKCCNRQYRKVFLDEKDPMENNTFDNSQRIIRYKTFMIDEYQSVLFCAELTKEEDDSVTISLESLDDYFETLSQWAEQEFHF